MFGIATWSHRFILLENGAADYTIPVSMPLEYLTEEKLRAAQTGAKKSGRFLHPGRHSRQVGEIRDADCDVRTALSFLQTPL